MKQREGYDVGVIVGRFQTDELHDGHHDLFKFVYGNCDKVIVVLGLSPCKSTINNPLDFTSRKLMVQEAYPKAEVCYIKDVYSDKVWSENLDKLIEDMTNPHQSVCLYGSRDSFIPYYIGKYTTHSLKQERFLSATERRKQISNKVKGTKEFRQGVIQATFNAWPKALPTVDIGILNEEGNELLLGRKPGEDKWRFIGGFVQPGDTFEESAIRETKEEAGVDLIDLQYVGSFVIDDWRYRAEVDKITTLLFIATKGLGTPKPGDDIAELCWFRVDEISFDDVIDTHHPLLKALLGKIPAKAGEDEYCMCIPKGMVADVKL